MFYISIHKLLGFYDNVKNIKKVIILLLMLVISFWTHTYNLF